MVNILEITEQLNKRVLPTKPVEWGKFKQPSGSSAISKKKRKHKRK
jgi:hypothetical protein